MELNNKEKKIQQVLSEVNYQVDTDFLWNEVSRELDEKKKKRRFIWIFPTLGLAALAFLFFNNFSIVSNDSAHLSNNNQLQSSTKINSADSHATVGNIKATSNTVNNVASNNTSSKIDIQSAKTNIENATKNSIAKNPRIKSSSSSALKPNSKTQKIQNVFTNKYNTSIDSKNISKGLLLKNTSALSNIASSTIEKQSNGNEKRVVDIYPYLNPLINIKKLEVESLDNNNNIDPGFVLVEPSRAQYRFYISAGLGSIKNITTSLKENQEISTELFDREKSLWGINAALQFGVKTKKGYKFFGGLDYAQLVTQYYNGETETVVEQNNSTLESIDANNNLTTTEGYLSSTTFIERDLLWHRHHNMLNIQLGVSKDLLPRSLFILEPEVSLLQNIVSSHKGYYFSDQSPEFIKFERGEENPYRKNTGLKTQVGLNLGYVTPQWQFAINTSWRNPLSNLTNGTNNYQIKNSQLSIQARVNYLLNWEKN